jgi:hypothetical protein
MLPVQNPMPRLPASFSLRAACRQTEASTCFAGRFADAVLQKKNPSPTFCQTRLFSTSEASSLDLRVAPVTSPLSIWHLETIAEASPPREAC